jgi:small neutral amino acid transporter SnatA (MarC family)
MILLPTKLFALKGSENMHLYRFAWIAAVVALPASFFNWNVFDISVGCIVLAIGWLLFGVYYQKTAQQRNWWIAALSIALLAIPPIAGVNHHLVASLDGWQLMSVRLLGTLITFVGLFGTLTEMMAKEERTRQLGRWLAIGLGLVVPFVTYGSMSMGLLGAGITVVVVVTVIMLVRPKPQVSTKEAQPV